jgi:nucleoside-diphosphate-sugar epimerase
VLASSGSVYGPVRGPVTEEVPPAAVDFYAVTKRAAELVLASYAPRLDGAVALRLFTPYGPGQRSRLVPSLAERIRSDEAITLNAGGRPRLSPTYVDDVVRAFSAALRLDGHHTVNVAGAEIVDIRSLAVAIGEALGVAPRFVSGDTAVAGDASGANARMKELLGIEHPVPLREGLTATVGSMAAV